MLEIAESFDGAFWDGVRFGRRGVSEAALANYFNYINFLDNSIIVCLKSRNNGAFIFLRARPQPTLGSVLDCQWAEGSGYKKRVHRYEFVFMALTDGMRCILIQPRLRSMSQEGISVEIEGVRGYDVGSRSARRYPARGVSATAAQEGRVFEGELLDFNSEHLRVRLTPKAGEKAGRLKDHPPVHLVLRSGGDVVYSSGCAVTRHDSDGMNLVAVLRPLADQICRLDHKDFRSMRQKLSPSPNAVFKHPLTGGTVILKVREISGAGFSVKEDEAEALLLPGMVILELSLEFAASIRIPCSAQVIYRIASDANGGEGEVTCGISITGIEDRQQVSLSNLLHQAANERTYVCSTVDLDMLWKLFFEAGFMYPRKYVHIHTEKEKFKDIYSRLYCGDSAIARHFIYQDKGSIKGHIAMLRFYSNTWLIHHHAAARAGGTPGISVLKQLVRYLNDVHSLRTTDAGYVACYFRPNNRFPQRLFGGCAKEIADPAKCSVDEFAYFLHYKPPCGDGATAGEELLHKARPEDLDELERIYMEDSGGLALRALDLTRGSKSDEAINSEFEKLELLRRRSVHVLEFEGEPAAVLASNVSDFGLNFSNLTNCIHVFVLRPEALPKDALNAALCRLAESYEDRAVPVLLYPKAYAEENEIAYDKVYQFWAFNMDYTDHFYRYMESVFGSLKLRGIG